MSKLHIKRGDEVIVIAGSHKGKFGRILSVRVGQARAVVEGIALQKKHLRKSELHPSGAIIEREGSVHISNLMLRSRYEERRLGKRNPHQA